jgi:protein-disulfide isomerase
MTPLLTVLVWAASPAVAEPAADEVVATWTGGSLTWSDVQPSVAEELAEMRREHLLAEYELVVQATEAAALQQIAGAAAAERGLASADALFELEVDAAVGAPDHAAVDAQVAELAVRYPDASRAELEAHVVQQLVRQAFEARYMAWISELRAAAGLKTRVSYPDLPRLEVPIGDGDVVRGPADAPVTVVEFMEFECYYCGQAAPTVERLLAAYPEGVRVVVKDLPLPFHARALPASVAARCADEQGHYAEMAEALFAHQDALSDDALRGYAKDAGVKLKAWDACVASGRQEAAIEAIGAQAAAIGVAATPTFLINGILVEGAQPFERLAVLVEQELARSE